MWPTSGARVLEAHYKYVERSCNFFGQNCPDVFILPSSQRCPLERIQSLTWIIQGRQQNKNSVFLLLFFFKSNSNISHFDYKIIIVDVIHQIYIKSYSKYHKLYITYFHQMIKWKLHSQIFFMVGVWLSGVFIFAGDNNDNKYEAIKSNINSRNCFLYWLWLPLLRVLNHAKE